MTYTAEEARRIRQAFKTIDSRWEIRQFLIDVKEFIDEKACDYKQKTNTEVKDRKKIELLEYLKEQFEGHIMVVDLLKSENPDNWR